MKCSACKRADVSIVPLDPKNPPALRQLCSNCLMDAALGGALIFSQNETEQDPDMVLESTLCKESFNSNCDRHSKDPENEPKTARFSQLRGYQGGTTLQVCKECLLFIVSRAAIGVAVSPTYKAPEASKSNAATLREDGSVSMGNTEFNWG